MVLSPVLLTVQLGIQSNVTETWSIFIIWDSFTSFSSIKSFTNCKKVFFFFNFHLSGRLCPIIILFRTDNFFLVVNQWHQFGLPLKQFGLPLKFKIPIFVNICLAYKQILMVNAGSPFSLCSKIHFSNTSSSLGQKRIPLLLTYFDFGIFLKVAFSDRYQQMHLFSTLNSCAAAQFLIFSAFSMTWNLKRAV